MKPEDIESLRVGLDTQVRLTAYNFRKTPPLAGKVIHISADRIQDQNSGTSAYLARVELNPAALERQQNIALYPGMPAEVMILLDERTLLDYLTNPLALSAYKAMREI